MDLKKHIQAIVDFPKKGIVFRDISPLLNDPKAFENMIIAMAKLSENFQYTHLLAVESRGFIIASALAFYLKKPLMLARKAGKLPPPTVKESYGLEYGNDQLEIKENLVERGSKFLIIDDVLATGGTIIACQKLLKKINCQALGAIVLVELNDLNGYKNLQENNIKFKSLLNF